MTNLPRPAAAPDGYRGRPRSRWPGLVPDAILPSQLHPRRATTPEEALYLAVAHGALDDLQKYRPDGPLGDMRVGSKLYGAKSRVLYERAWRWLCDPDYPSPISMRAVCDIVRIDQAAVRAAIKRSFPPPRELFDD